MMHLSIACFVPDLYWTKPLRGKLRRVVFVGCASLQAALEDTRISHPHSTHVGEKHLIRETRLKQELAGKSLHSLLRSTLFPDECSPRNSLGQCLMAQAWTGAQPAQPHGRSQGMSHHEASPPGIQPLRCCRDPWLILTSDSHTLTSHPRAWRCVRDMVGLLKEVSIELTT